MGTWREPETEHLLPASMSEGKAADEVRQTLSEWTHDTSDDIHTNPSRPVRNDDEKKTQEFQLVVYIESATSDDSYDNLFQDPKKLEYYLKIYEDSQYECRHLLDPNLTWTTQEEKKILRKNDWKVTFFAFCCFTALNFDRYNLGQALADNFLQDNKMTTNDYNLGQTINLICFLASELPSQLILKKLGPEIWIPVQMVAWSIVSMCQAAITNKKGYYATRALLGLFQGGFIADICLWMLYFYTGPELPLRMGIFYILNPMTQVWTALLSLGLLKIKNNTLNHGWQWLFLLEGIGTFVVGVAAFFHMSPSVVKTKKWFRPKGWYTEREEKILVNKVLRDDPTKGLMANHTPVGLKELFKALCDYDLAWIYIMRILVDIGASPTQLYLTLLLRQMGFNTLETNALTIPYSIISCILMLISCWVSERFNERALTLAFQPFWVMICLIPFLAWKGFMKEQWGTYALLTVLLSHAPSWPISITWCLSNSNSVRNRTVLAAVVNIFSQVAAIIAANIYRKDDAPMYRRGNKDLIGIAAGALVWTMLARCWFQWRNYSNLKKWNAMTKEEQDDYMVNTKDEGNKRLDFRFVY